ncbi:MAG TPA: DUF4149 domain-containing protein [Ferrovibrio sp.]|jgi:hypothetical protein|uniref:DUF4149 domain-containing protein n=1 Tax=Ferrovibrio sp. TaxID=1917215 RepID=UPI002ED601BC
MYVEGILIIVAVFATGLLLGAMLFHTFLITPMVFLKLDPLPALKFIRALLSLYYMVIAGMATLAALALVALQDNILAGTMGFVAVLAAFVHQGLMPRMHSLHDAVRWGEDDARPKFRKLHRLSMAINGVQMFAVASVLLDLAY